MKNVQQHRPKTSLIMLATLLFCLTSCATTPQNNSLTSEITEIKQLAVMPFITVSGSARHAKELDKTLDCELSGLCYIDREVLSLAEKTLTRQLSEALAERINNMLSQQIVTDYYLRLPKEQHETPRKLVLQMGHDLEADHVVVGLVSRYQNRIGGALTADTPASITFRLYLVDVVNQKLVWEGHFDKTQQGLSANLLEAGLFFNYGFKWLRIDELSEHGMEKILEDFPVPVQND
ncbi:MAG: hypothetical protein U9R29_00715 [Thermodesulfobacteriota bacterium]|nr:hypothetical protein [Thermodesulfobacteriota bacterium]